MSATAQPKKSRQHRLNIRLSSQEWDRILYLSAGTTCRNISDYARKVLLKEPVTVFYRNQSFDAFEEQMIHLLPELERSGDNFDQLIKKLSPIRDVPEIQALLPQLTAAQSALSSRVSWIKSHLEKLYDQCVQK